MTGLIHAVPMAQNSLCQDVTLSPAMQSRVCVFVVEKSDVRWD